MKPEVPFLTARELKVITRLLSELKTTLPLTENMRELQGWVPKA